MPKPSTNIPAVALYITGGFVAGLIALAFFSTSLDSQLRTTTTVNTKRPPLTPTPSQLRTLCEDGCRDDWADCNKEANDNNDHCYGEVLNDGNNNCYAATLGEPFDCDVVNDHPCANVYFVELESCNDHFIECFEGCQ